MKKTYRKQDFKFTQDQRQRHDLLLELRRSHVAEYYEDGRVWVGPSMAGKKLEEDDAEWKHWNVYVHWKLNNFGGHMMAKFFSRHTKLLPLVDRINFKYFQNNINHL